MTSPDQTSAPRSAPTWSTRWAWPAACAALLAVVAYLVLETRRVAEVAGTLEVEGRRARDEVLDTRARLTAEVAAALRDRAAVESSLRAEILRLEQQLEEALEHARAVGEALAAEAEERERRAAELATLGALGSMPPPFGVQRCLDTFAELLRFEGFQGLRLLRASAIEDMELRDVELLGAEASGVHGGLLVADRMTATLDRAAGRLELRFHDGHRRNLGVRAELPEDGYLIVLEPVVGRAWEARLPYLVRARGQYPPAPDRPRPDPDEVDPITRSQWLERFDELLRSAGTRLHLRLGGFRKIEAGRFVGARLFGYNDSRLLELSADCGDLAVEVDAAAAVVSLVLRDGTLLREGTESTIGAQGYRMLLPDLTPEQATATMLGMVVRK